MSVSLSTAGVPTTGTVTSTGLGSGLDINSIVTAIVNAQIKPKQTLLQSGQSADQTSISALGAVKSALSSLQTAVEAIATGGALSQLSAQSSSQAVFSATAGSAAVSGSYQVQVQTLAQANTIKSGVFSDANAAVGSGPYSITAGGKSFSVTLGSGNSTLSGLASAINSASDNGGVSATIVHSTGGAYLLLTATQTGTANAVSVSAAAPVAFTSVQGAADATGTIAGLPFSSSSNIVSGVLDGVTLNLASASPDTTQTLTVSANTQAAASAVQAFVAAYNAALSLIGAETAFTPGSGGGSAATVGTAAPLLGDVAIKNIQYQLAAIVGGSAGSGGAYSVLSQIGVKRGTDGALTVDSTVLNAAVQANPAGVKGLFTGTAGLGTSLDTLLNNVVGAAGILDGKTKALQTHIDSAALQLADLVTRSSQLTQQYYAQFNAMDSIVAAYKGTSDLLTQLYAPRKVDSNSG